MIPQQIIEQTGATSLQDLLRTSPGITFGAGEGGQPLADRPFIRGQASANNVFLDGIRDTGGQQREVFALEQVEVIKGPDSVYSGRGSGGGAINLSTKQPRLEQFTTRLPGRRHRRLSARHGRLERAAGRDRRPAHQPDGRPGRHPRPRRRRL